MAHLLVVGSLAYDSIETPSGRVDKTLGGSANYFSLAGSLYAPIRVVGVVGEDYSDQDMALLSQRKVDITGLIRQSGKTFHWEGAYEGDMNEAVTKKTDLNVFAHFNPQLPPSYRDSSFVFLANIDPELQLQVLKQVQNPRFVGMDTMNYWIQSKKDSLKKVLTQVDAVLINEHESMMLTGASNAISAAKLTCAMGPQLVVIKRGEYGFVMYHQDHGFFILPAFPIESVVDPTGAGDTFAGGFFGYLCGLGDKDLSYDDFKLACLKGTILASFTVQDFGVKSLAKITMDDWQHRLKQYYRVVGTHNL